MAIKSFDGEYRFLSNFFPIEIEFDNMSFPCVESAYQAAKTDSIVARQPFMDYSPGEAKQRGKQLVKRDRWEEIRLGVMESLLRQKFANKELRAMLLATGDQELIEGNKWNDFYWGVCKGKGENHLGKLLMKIRKELS